MIDLLGPVPAWIGILDAFAVVFAFVVWTILRGASDRVRGVASALGVTMLAYLLLHSFGRVTAFVSQLVSFGWFDRAGGRGVTDILLMVAGLAIGVYVVIAAHQRVAFAEEDIADDATVEADETDEDESDAYTRQRERLVAYGPWVDVAAIAVAASLPVVRVVLGGFSLDPARDVTVVVALYHLVAGLLAALPLYVTVARNDLDDQRPIAAAFGLVALGSLVLPIWPGLFANEFWSAFGSGLAAGLVGAAALSLIGRAVPFDRMAAAGGAIIGLALVVLSAVLSARVIVESQEALRDSFQGQFDEGDLPEQVFPTP